MFLEAACKLAERCFWKQLAERKSFICKYIAISGCISVCCQYLVLLSDEIKRGDIRINMCNFFLLLQFLFFLLFFKSDEMIKRGDIRINMCHQRFKCPRFYSSISIFQPRSNLMWFFLLHLRLVTGIPPVSQCPNRLMAMQMWCLVAFFSRFYALTQSAHARTVWSVNME